jgi:hypothetical protein
VFNSGVIVGWIRSYGRLLGADSCNFGAADQLDICGWNYSNLSSLQWQLSTGLGANWIGGPGEDGNEDKEGRGVLHSTYSADMSISYFFTILPLPLVSAPDLDS